MAYKKGDKIPLKNLPKQDKNKYQATINDIIDVLNSKNTDEVKLLWCSNSLKILESWFTKDELTPIKICKNKLIPITEKLVEKSSIELMGDFFDVYKRMYAFVGRRDLECFIDYMEFGKSNKVLAERRPILKPFIDALNRIAFDDKLKYIIASFPPSSGKSFSANYFTAWLYGLSINHSVLRLSYNEELVLGFSRSIKEIIANPLFSDVFSQYKLYGNKPFDKEKESDWKIKNAMVLTSHISRTRDGGTTGVRANKAIIFDDMTKGAEEASNSTIHQNYYNKWKTEWSNRKDGKNTKYIFLGTMWSPEDILNRVREDREKISPLIPSKKYPYTWETEDGSTIVIRVPMLDDNNMSTCEDVYTTEEAREIRDTTDPYLYQCVYQQDPIAPSGLEFSDELLEHYDRLPLNEEGSKAYPDYCFASLDTPRKGGDNLSMPIFIHAENGYYYLIDCLFKRKAMTSLYDDIINKIINYNITRLVIENNTDTSLKTLLDDRLLVKGYIGCVITEKFNTKNKEQRIGDTRDVAKKLIRFKNKSDYNPNTDYGRFMKDFTTYSFDFKNKHDDANDSIALFTSEIIMDKGRLSKPIPLKRSDYGI